MDVEEITKKIQAEITLNDDDEVKAIELTASAYIDGISDEVLVTKVKETSSKYTITTSNTKITWDIEEEEDGEVEFPKVYIDGVRGDIRDIVPGMVLSIYGTDLDTALELDDTESLSDLKIYAVTTGVVEGEASRIKKADYSITLDGTVYAASNANVTMSTEELEKYTDADELVSSDLEAVVDNDTVTLYLNMFGEYAYILLEEVASNWTFGVVTYVSSNITFEGEDEEIAVRNIKVLLNDGSKKTYKLKVDTDDEDTKDVVDFVVGDTNGYDALAVGNVVALNADADKVVTVEDGDEIIIISKVEGTAAAPVTTVVMKELDGTAITADNNGNYMIDDYMIRPVGTLAADKDDEEFGANYEYEYTSNTVIFNANLKEVVTKWKAILNGANFADNATLAIFEDDEEEEALYMIVSLAENAYGNEDAIYAIVEESENIGDENYVKFVGSEEMEAKDINLLDEGWLVAYRTASSKVSEVQKLIDVENIVDAADTKKVYDYLFAQTTEAVNAQHGTIANTACTSGCTVADHDHTSATATAWDTCAETSPCASGCTTEGHDHTGSTVTAWDSCATTTLPCPNASETTTTGTCSGGCTLVREYAAATTEDIFFALTTTTAPSATKFVNNINTTTTLEQIVLDEVEVKTSGKITLKYVETGDNDVAIGSVKLDKDLIKVYDLRNGEVEEIDIDALVEEVNVEGEEVYVLAAVNGDYDNEGANIVFIVK